MQLLRPHLEVVWDAHEHVLLAITSRSDKSSKTHQSGHLILFLCLSSKPPPEKECVTSSTAEQDTHIAELINKWRLAVSNTTYSHIKCIYHVRFLAAH